MKKSIITTKKFKTMTTALFSAMAIVSVTASVFADTTLTDKSNTGSSEVSAKIAGDDEPGNVSYMITIPEKIDFGTLTQPSDDSADHYKDVEFNVMATQVNGFENHSDWYVRVKVKDQNYKFEEDERFFITQKTVSYPDSSNGNNKFEYGVYLGEDNIADRNRKDENGINLAFFRKAGDQANVKIRLNQNQLYGCDLKSIAGDYSGSLVFHSSIVSTTQTN